MPDAELMLMLLADARLPAGGHTQSAGLEAALNARMPVAEIPDYVRTRLRTVVAVDAAVAVLARHHAAAPLMDSDAEGWTLPDALARVDAAWRARTISPALRSNAQLLGRGYLRLVLRLWPAHPAVAAVAELPAPARPVVVGVAAAAAGLSAGQVVRLVAYDDVQGLAAAALKLHPMDPAEATRWVVAAVPAIERMVSALSTIRTVADLPAVGAPLIEQWAELHAAAPQRLFRA